MRLSMQQVTTIQTIVRQELGNAVHILVYGSRLDDKRKGGDLDLLLETHDRVDRLQRAGLKLRLEASLQIPVDVMIYQSGTVPSAFQAIALAQAVALEDVA